MRTIPEVYIRLLTTPFNLQPCQCNPPPPPTPIRPTPWNLQLPRNIQCAQRAHESPSPTPVSETTKRVFHHQRRSGEVFLMSFSFLVSIKLTPPHHIILFHISLHFILSIAKIHSVKAALWTQSTSVRFGRRILYSRPSPLQLTDTRTCVKCSGEFWSSPFPIQLLDPSTSVKCTVAVFSGLPVRYTINRYLFRAKRPLIWAISCTITRYSYLRTVSSRLLVTLVGFTLHTVGKRWWHSGS